MGPSKVGNETISRRCNSYAPRVELWADPFSPGQGELDFCRMTVDPFVPPPGAPLAGPVFFERRELDLILRLYGRMVAQGEWRDYAIDTDKDACAFCVFRRTSEAPLYRIEKRPGLARRQGQWAVIAPGNVVLRRGHELEPVLRAFDGRKFRVVE